MADYTRRQFLGLMAATAAGLGLSKTIQGRLLAVTEQTGTWYDRVETRVKSVCELCPGGCDLAARVINGMPGKTDGHPLHPATRGRRCPRALAVFHSLYDPAPPRTGPRGTTGGVRHPGGTSSWALTGSARAGTRCWR